MKYNAIMQTGMMAPTYEAPVAMTAMSAVALPKPVGR